MAESPESFRPGQDKSSMPQQLPGSSAGPDWSDLPADMLIRIFLDLDILDLFSVRAVCQSWRLSYLVARRLGPCSRCSNRSPCLLYSCKNDDPNTATLLRLTNKKLYRIVLPDPPLGSCFVVGSSGGWLAIADERSELILVNPITRAQIALPPPLTIKNVRGCYTADGVLDGYRLHELDLENQDRDTQIEPDDLNLEQGHFYFYLRIAMSADPSSGNCIVMVQHMHRNHLSFARVGDAEWTWISVDQRCCDYNNFFYNDSDGLFYAVRVTGEVHAIDLNGPSAGVKVILKLIAYLIDNYKYIVKSPWGDILQVWRYDEFITEDDKRTLKLKVYMVDLVGQRLVEIQNLKEHVLFIGFNTPFFLPAKDYPMLTPNCIYFTEDSMDYIYCHKFGQRHVAVFNMEDGSFTDLFPGSNSRQNWPLPIWITPSYSQSNKGKIHVAVPNNSS